MSEEQEAPQENIPEPLKPQNTSFNYGIQQSLPNATPVLVLGILSILTCCCYGVIGLVLSIVALILSKKDRAMYAAHMSFYTESSFKNLNAGRVCAIVGLILNILCILLMIAFIAIFGWAALSDPEKMKEMLEGYQ